MYSALLPTPSNVVQERGHSLGNGIEGAGGIEGGGGGGGKGCNHTRGSHKDSSAAQNQESCDVEPDGQDGEEQFDQGRQWDIVDSIPE